jgi:hypothetical protein
MAKLVISRVHYSFASEWASAVMLRNQTCSLSPHLLVIFHTRMASDRGGKKQKSEKKGPLKKIVG